MDTSSSDLKNVSNEKEPTPAIEMSVNRPKRDQPTPMATLTSWAQNSSCHGIGSIERSSHVIRKIMWVIIFLGFSGEFQVYMYMVYLR